MTLNETTMMEGMSNGQADDRLPVIEKLVDFIDEKQGFDIVALDLKNESAVAEYYIVATGKNNRHVAALASDVEQELAKYGFVMNHKEGHREGEWVVLDYNAFIVHIFNQDKRDYYKIQNVYKNAIKIIEK